MENQHIFFTSGIEALKKKVREIKKTETRDMLGPKTAEKSLKGLSKSGKMGAVALLSQENIQESKNSGVPSMENKILATQS